MRKQVLLIGCLLALGAGSVVRAFPDSPKIARPAATCSSLDPARPDDLLLPPDTIALADADAAGAFQLYEGISGRSVIPGSNLPSPRLNYRLQLSLPRREALQALDTLLAQHGITMIAMGSNFVKAVRESETSREAAPETSLPAHQLPDSNTYVQYTTRLQHRSVNSVVPLLTPLLRLPNSIVTMPSSNTLILRDYSANVRRALGVVQRFDVPDDGEVFVDPAAPGRKPPRRAPN